MSKGKEKVAHSDKRMLNACQVVYIPFKNIKQNYVNLLLYVVFVE